MKRVLEKLTAEIAITTLAYGLFLASTSTTLWGDYVRIVVGSCENDVLLIEFFVRNAVFCVTLFSAGVIGYVRPKAIGWRSPLVALTLFVVGELLLAALCAGFISQNMLLVLVGACFAYGSACMFCSLQEIVAAQRVFDAGVVVFTAAGVSALLCFFMGAINAVINPLVTLSATTAAAALLARVAQRRMRKVHPMFETIPARRTDRCKDALSELWRPLLCVAFSSLIVGIVRVGSLGFDLLGKTNESNIIGLFVSCIVLLATWRFVYERVTLTRLYVILFPLTATAFLLLPLLDGSFREIALSLVFVVFSVTSALMVVSCARAARNQSLPPVMVYGLFAGVVYSSGLVGSAAGFPVASISHEIGISELTVVALVAIYLLSILMMVPSRKNDAASMVVAAEQVTAVAEEGDATAARCAVAVGRYALSRREAEVFLLLARGRDVVYIADELMISKNTVRTHIKNIFAKTSVHSRQELIDLVESIEA